jgi:hypothetical protein
MAPMQLSSQSDAGGSFFIRRSLLDEDFTQNESVQFSA